MKKLTFLLLAVFMLQFSLVSAASAKDSLANGETLAAGQQLTSNDGRFFLKMQTDGNLVLYTSSGQSYWSTSTNKATIRIYDPFCGCTRVRTADKLVLEGGSLVIKIVQNPVWRSDNLAFSKMWYQGTNQPLPANLYGDKLIMQDDGNLVLYNTTSGSWYPVWASHTGGR
ncbi:MULTISPECIES: hypothetical protein [Paenibacillus]|uniref:hypothetical protein n=1 Tax=Paenibacillus TaxID=44249 RepID=UPI0022B9223E|nr:hypothetical protein [Paenibacillus caseinilyticus]MCZ8522246.1 hypothetical protein [Paenibacillus caseinilyticus]